MHGHIWYVYMYMRADTVHPSASVLLHTRLGSISMYWYHSVCRSYHTWYHTWYHACLFSCFFGRLHCWPDADVGNISCCQTGDVGVVIASLISAWNYEVSRPWSLHPTSSSWSSWSQLCCQAIGNAITGSTVRQLQERHQERLADAQAKLKECLLEGVLTEDRVEPRHLCFFWFRFVPRMLPWMFTATFGAPVITTHHPDTLCTLFFPICAVMCCQFQRLSKTVHLTGTYKGKKQMSFESFVLFGSPTCVALPSKSWVVIKTWRW